jgi:hypothetical protein
MNSRRLMLAPCAKSKPSSENSVVHHSKIRLLMSALGQKQTSRPEISMSALPPKADIAGRQSDVR